MKKNNDFINELEKLFSQYEREVREAESKGYLAMNTAKTYLVHSENFIKWCKDEFEPGRRNK